MRLSLTTILISLISAAVTFAADSPVKLADLTAEHMTNPMGIGVAKPRLSWKLISDRPGEVQKAYEVRAASAKEKLNQPDLWSSGKVASDQSVLVPWAGKELGSRAQVVWQVRVWDKDDKVSDWSEPATIELGLLDAAKEWKGQWITADLPRVDAMESELAKTSWINAGSQQNQPAQARYTLNLPENAKVHGASIDIQADGLISLYVNGKPTLQGSTSHTAPFHADFPQQLQGGKNIIAINSAAVRLARGGGAVNAIAARAVIQLEDGQKIVIVTDGSWKAFIPPAPAGRGRGAPGGAGGAGGFGAVNNGGAAGGLNAANAPSFRAGGGAPPDPNSNWFASDYDDGAWAAATVVGPYKEVQPVRSADDTIGPVRYLRKAFTAKPAIAKARLYATALGIYQASINGKLVSEDQFAPGWTDYNQRVMVQTYDVTSMITPGQNNVLSAAVADGWFAGRVGWTGLAQYARVGTRPLFNAQLEITYTDGSTDVVATDTSWKAGPGRIVGSDMQLGEIIDARDATAYDQPSFDDKSWTAAVSEQHDNIALGPQVGPPVRRLMELKPKSITRMGNVWIVDLGQVMVGRVRLTAKGTAGTQIDVTHGEMLNSDGSLYTENLRTAISLDRFILRGDSSPETFEPQFTFHGFRYVGITGYPGELTADNIRGIVVGSDTPDIGKFESSNPDVNQLFSNIRWGQRGNYLSVPTDCPQRDERMGWMGDAQVFSPTAAMNADVASFFDKWLRDVNDAQRADGAFNNVSPKANENQSYPVWADAGVVIPWVMYTTYGDPAFLARSYDHMTRYVDYTKGAFPNLLPTGGVGDHLAPAGGRGGAFGAGGAGRARGPASLPAGAAAGARRGAGRGFGGGGFGGGVSTTNVVDAAYFAHSAWICSQAAKLLGKPDDAAKYDQLFHDIRDAFNKAFVHEDGSMEAGTQTTYALALQFDLLPEQMRPLASKHLTEDIEQRNHLTTGFVGVSWINLVLSEIGRSDLAYQLLLTDTYPSWLFEVKHGATTMWERWDGWTPDNGFQASSMNSFNHYSFGAVGKWFYAGAAGIQLDEQHPGFKQFNLKPQLTDKLGYVKASYNSPYGLIVSNWQIKNGQATYDATVPPNSTATLTLPASGSSLKVSGAPVSKTEVVNSNSVMDLPPGTYHFSFPAAK